MRAILFIVFLGQLLCNCEANVDKLMKRKLDTAENPPFKKRKLNINNKEAFDLLLEKNDIINKRYDLAISGYKNSNTKLKITNDILNIIKNYVYEDKITFEKVIDTLVNTEITYNRLNELMESNFFKKSYFVIKICTCGGNGFEMHKVEKISYPTIRFRNNFCIDLEEDWSYYQVVANKFVLEPVLRSYYKNLYRDIINLLIKIKKQRQSYEIENINYFEIIRKLLIMNLIKVYITTTKKIKNRIISILYSCNRQIRVILQYQEATQDTFLSFDNIERIDVEPLN